MVQTRQLDTELDIPLLSLSLSPQLIFNYTNYYW